LTVTTGKSSPKFPSASSPIPTGGATVVVQPAAAIQRAMSAAAASATTKSMLTAATIIQQQVRLNSRFASGNRSLHDPLFIPTFSNPNPLRYN
jgi:hypothetical protein